MRLSIGTADDDRLRCRYHGWSFASGSGACLGIPAHPLRKPSSAVSAVTWRAHISHGLVWTSIAERDAADLPFPVDGWHVLRDLAVALEPSLALSRLAASPFFLDHVASPLVVARDLDEVALLSGQAAGAVLIQPTDAATVILRPIISQTRIDVPIGRDQLGRRWDAQCETLRRTLEYGA